MTNVFHRTLKSTPPNAIGGQGVYLFDNQGNKYLDASGGAAISCLGHQNPIVVDAIKEQAGKLAYAHTGFFSNEPAERLAEMLVERAPEGIGKVFFVSGGSEAIESALKLARQYFWDRGEPARHKIIARRQSYHGNTLGALSVGGNEWRRLKFEPFLMDVGRISPCYAYRYQMDGESAEAYGRRAADELESTIQDMEPGTVAAFVAETVVGATAGAVTPVPGYFKRIREICDRYGILLILDEVMCGVGRTGTWFACEQEGVVPDMITIAKGLAAGYQPIGALLVAEKIYEEIKSTSGFFQHNFSFMGHPIACAAGVATLNVIEKKELLNNVQVRGKELMKNLADRFQDAPNVGDIRGRGLFQAIEFVSDRVTKLPIDARLQFAANLKRVAFKRGLICYPMAGTIDGQRGDHVLLAPPFIVTREEIDNIVDILGDAVDEVVQELGLVK